jgi:hypothetical protein
MASNGGKEDPFPFVVYAWGTEKGNTENQNANHPRDPLRPTREWDLSVPWKSIWQEDRSPEFPEFFSSWEEARGRSPLSVPANVFCSSILGEAEEKSRRHRLFPKFLFGGGGPGKGALRRSKSFFDHSKARLHCKSKTRPAGSDPARGRDGRFASLRMGTEKILIRAQSVLFRSPRKGAEVVSFWATACAGGASPKIDEQKPFPSLRSAGTLRGLWPLASWKEERSSGNSRDKFLDKKTQKNKMGCPLLGFLWIHN